MASLRICSVDVCDKPVEAKGLCNSHYYRLKRYGDPLGGGTPNGAPVAWLNEHKNYQGDDCLKGWPFSVFSNGYPKLRVRGKGSTAASRVMCELVHGPVPAPSMHAAHSCGKGSEGCLNPRHLSWKTPRENCADRVQHGTSGRGEQCRTAKLTGDDVHCIRCALAWGDRAENLANKYGVSSPTISDIKHRRRWAWLGPKELPA